MITLALTAFALAAFDGWLTRRRMRSYGLWVELNPVIRWLSAILGIELGVVLGVMIPAVSLIALLVKLHLEVGLALIIGFRLKLFVTQLQSLAFEHEIVKLKKELDKGLASQVKPPSLDESPDSETLSSPKDDNDRES